MQDMLVRLYDLPDGSALLKKLADQGITVRRAMPYDRHVIMDWIRTAFNEYWVSECEVAFSHQPVSCFVATEAGRVIGFGCYDCTCKDFFGPTGVDESKRGYGIGKALLLECLRAMAASGYAYAIIGGVGPAEFYAKAVGAVLIENSTPGIFKDYLKKDPSDSSAESLPG